MRPDILRKLLLAAIAVPTTAVTTGCPPCDEHSYVATSVLESYDLPIDATTACELYTSAELSGDKDGQIEPEECAIACGDAKYNRCRLDDAYMNAWNDLQVGGAGGGPSIPCPTQSAVLTCEATEQTEERSDSCVAGRRPAGLVNVAVSPSSPGGFLASAAYFEAAAVIAFERLASEFRALGAPRDLVIDLERAARDEIRHAKTMAHLADGFGAQPEAVQVGPARDRTAFEIALENVVEGLVNETFSAATALFQAQHASDVRVQRALAVIADDECAHAALALRMADFLLPLLTESEKIAVQNAFEKAVRGLPHTFQEPSAEVHHLLGAPTVVESLQIYRRLCQTLWNLPVRSGQHTLHVSAFASDAAAR